MIQFYSPDIETTGMLPADESAHCCRVLRMKEGDSLRVVDGKGGLYECRLVSADPKGAMVDIVSVVRDAPHWGVKITLAVAPTKNIDRMEWLLEKAVEIGVDSIVLLKCDRSERKVVKTERLRKIMISAMNQSLKTTLPTLTDMVPLKEFVGGRLDGSLYMGYCDSETERKNFVCEYNGGDVTFLIGPEGDFTPAEVRMALEKGFMPVTFGESRLRTETAALFAVEAVHILCQSRSGC